MCYIRDIDVHVTVIWYDYNTWSQTFVIISVTRVSSFVFQVFRIINWCLNDFLNFLNFERDLVIGLKTTVSNSINYTTYYTIINIKSWNDRKKPVVTKIAMMSCNWISRKWGSILSVHHYYCCYVISFICYYLSSYTKRARYIIRYSCGTYFTEKYKCMNHRCQRICNRMNAVCPYNKTVEQNIRCLFVK